MKKLLFLDIDGVLNNVGQMVCKQPSRMDAANLSKDAVKIVEWICDTTGAQVYISSTWRIGRTVDWFKGLFEAYGWVNPPIVGLTPIHNNINATRGEEILSVCMAQDEIVEYVILDDDSDMLPEQLFVKVDPAMGLTIKDAIRVCKLLGVKPEHEVKFKQIEQFLEY